MLLKYHSLKVLWYCILKADLFPPKRGLQEARAIFQTLLVGKYFHQWRVLGNELSVCTTPVCMFSCFFWILPFARHVMRHKLQLSYLLKGPALHPLEGVKWPCRGPGAQIRAPCVLTVQCLICCELLALLLEPNAFRNHQMMSRKIIYKPIFFFF